MAGVRPPRGLVRLAARTLALMLAVIAVAGCTGMASPSPVIQRGPAPAPTTTIPASSFASGDPLLPRLRSGGWVLVIRHAEARAPRDEVDRVEDPADCSVQPTLTAAGREQARALGAALRRLAIPVQAVMASPWCATRDTAFLAFEHVQAASDLDPPTDAAERQRLGRRVRALASAPPPAGTNTVLVTHAATAAAAFGITPAEGETLVVRPGSETPEVVRRVPSGDWQAMAGGSRPTTRSAPRTTAHRVGGHRPVDVAAASAGAVWWAAPDSGQVGRLDPRSGRVRAVRLGTGAAPRAVVIGPDGAPWVADAGRNAIVRVDPRTLAVRSWPLPAGRPSVELAGLTFDGRGVLWFTGRRGVVGRLDPGSGSVEVFDAPAGSEPGAIITTQRGEVFYVATRAGHLGRVDLASGATEPVAPPTAGPLGQAAADANGRVWVAQPGSGRVAVYDPASDGWHEWRLPGAGGPTGPDAVWVDPGGTVWLGDTRRAALTTFDPRTERFETVTLPAGPVARLTGRGGDVWAAVPSAGRLVVLRGQ